MHRSLAPCYPCPWPAHLPWQEPHVPHQRVSQLLSHGVTSQHADSWVHRGGTGLGLAHNQRTVLLTSGVCVYSRREQG